jgi:hypothetical protein
MKTLTTDELVTVAGGTTAANQAVTTQLTALQSSIKDVATAQTNNGSTNNPTMMMAMMMAMRPQAPAVIAAPAPAAGPVINVSTRAGRRW